MLPVEHRVLSDEQKKVYFHRDVMKTTIAGSNSRTANQADPKECVLDQFSR